MARAEAAPGRPRGLGLAARLTLLLAVIAGLGALVMGVYVSRALEEQAVARLRHRLASEARLLRDPLAAVLDLRPGATEAQALAQRYAALLGARVTVIAADGAVLAESDRASVLEIESHAGRPEVRRALAGEVGSDIRRSATVGRDLLYLAVPLERAGRPTAVLRLAVPTDDVERARAVVRRTVLGGALLALAVTIVVGLFVSRRVTRPVRAMQDVAGRMAAGDFARTVPVSGTDEIAALGEALNRLAVALQERVERLHGEQAKVRTILDGMVEGVVALDDRGRVLFLNPAVRRMLGVDEAPTEGRPLLEVIRQKALLDLVEAASGAAGPVSREVDLGPPVNRTVSARAAVLRLGGSPPGVLLVLHDVTELRRLERVRSEFVANVSHELRTPLTCIRGYLETLLDGAVEDPQQARRFLEIAGTHAERLGRMVEELLQLAEIESGRLVLAPVPLDLAEVATGVAKMLEHQASQKAQSLEVAVPPGAMVRADRDRLVQILVNLVENAVKFTPAGGRIRIEAGPVSADQVAVRVTDTGVGIAPADLPRITERFYRADRARSRELGGSGLGLAIVKHLVHAHGGELRIESLPGRGTTVSVTLPRAAGGAPV
jgi:two-component system phosphate regulon sensor histidine kinase PhoR